MEQDATVTSSTASASASASADRAAVDRFLSLMELERIDRDIFRAWNPARDDGRRHNLFGGQVAAHALRAATMTIDVEHHPHSLHGYFLRPGKDDAPTILRVDRIRDGRSFTTRTVVALQDGEAIFSLTASFQKDEPGGEFQTQLDTAVPTPQELLADGVETHDWWGPASPFERVEVPSRYNAGRPRRLMWVRTRDRLPDDRALHACVLTYISDMGVVGAVRAALGRFEHHGMGASLDHSVWFHRHARADEWLLFDVESTSNANSRGLGIGHMHTIDGTHAVSIAQEALVRLPQ
ncbi:MAG TPA: acyl-CoA thioesterase domain-containing protein [Mycobacteriales bacterium]|nr:acyl-CoA thioesterase domain-containing protein [Mycobacteriales bacterium]